MIDPVSISHALLLVPVNNAFKERVIVLAVLVAAYLIYKKESEVVEQFMPRCDWQKVHELPFKQYRYVRAFPILGYCRNKNNG